MFEALQCNDINSMKTILKNALLETSNHWQERALFEGKAKDSDFFYDTYIGTDPALLRMNKHE
jgi:hypothetical protein